MINTINSIPESISIERLHPYTRNPDVDAVLGSVEEMETNETDADMDTEDTYICDSDLVLFCTSNTSDESYLQFHIYDKEHDDFVIHHDVFVVPSINDASYTKINDKHIVALATCDKHVMLYDSLVFNPMAPQLLLQGHDASVLCVLNVDNTLCTGGEDKCIVKWDLEKCSSYERQNVDLSVEKLCVSAGMTFYSEKDVIKSTNGEIFSVNGDIENIVGYDNNVYITTNAGYLVAYDTRNLQKPCFCNQYKESPMTGIDILNNRIAMCSLSGDVVILDRTDYETVDTESIKAKLFSVKLNENNVVFYGDDSHVLKMKKLSSKVFA